MNLVSVEGDIKLIMKSLELVNLVITAYKPL